MAAFAVKNLNRWIAPGGGLAAGAVTVATVLLIPRMTLEDLVWNSGIAALMPVAEPPLGSTARAVLALGGGLLVAAVMWAGLFLLFGKDGLFDPNRAAASPGTHEPTADPTVDSIDVDNRVPTLRRADAHPDAPARRPLSARDLGSPMPPVAADPVASPVVRPLPDDLDQPLAAFDPAAVPDAPREPVRPVAPLKAPALAAGERITSVELPRVPSVEDGAPSIETLLRRLEQGTQRPRRAATG